MAKPQLYLFHFAGGNVYSFQFLTPLLKDFDVIPLELPGRGRRIGEPLLKDFELAVHDMYNQVNKHVLNTDIILYGHSLGAYLAFGVATMLEAAGSPAVHLLVSGNAGPGTGDAKNRYLMDRDDFMEELKLLGGIPKAFLDDRELVDFFEPILRADFELAERNRLAMAAPLNTPLFAMMGSLEAQVALLPNWGKFSCAQFGYEIFEGDHFFIYKHAQRIAEIICGCCNVKNTKQDCHESIK